MRKTLCIIGLLGTLGLFTACGAWDRAADAPGEPSGRIGLPSAQPASSYGKKPEAAGGGADAELPSEFMAYLKGFAGGSMTVDIVEWVTLPGSRADELGYTEDDAPGGFVIYNPDEAERTLELSADCKITIRVWEKTNETKEVSADEFAAVLKERGEQGLGTPYRIATKDGKVVSVLEQYVP